MGDQEKTESPGAALVAFRWRKASKAERLRVSRMLNAAKAAKKAAELAAEASGTVRSKRKPARARK
jgi:hypothetical protein